MEEMLSARKFAIRTKRKVRTVQGWVDRGEVRDVQKVGTSWVAPLSAWEESAKIERRPGPKTDADKAKTPNQP